MHINILLIVSNKLENKLNFEFFKILEQETRLIVEDEHIIIITLIL